MIIPPDLVFDAALFISKVDNLFIKLIDGIMRKDLSDIKHYLSPEIYERYNKLLKNKRCLC